MPSPQPSNMSFFSSLLFSVASPPYIVLHHVAGVDLPACLPNWGWVRFIRHIPYHNIIDASSNQGWTSILYTSTTILDSIFSIFSVLIQLHIPATGWICHINHLLYLRSFPFHNMLHTMIRFSLFFSLITDKRRRVYESIHCIICDLGDFAVLGFLFGVVGRGKYTKERDGFWIYLLKKHIF